MLMKHEEPSGIYCVMATAIPAKAMCAKCYLK